MGEKYITEKCKFSCSAGAPNVIINVKETTEHKTKINGHTALTSNAQVSIGASGGTCSKLPQNQSGINCKPGRRLGIWTKYSKNFAGGKNLLLESSEFKCLECGGTISVLINSVPNTYKENIAAPILTEVQIKSVENDSAVAKNANNESVSSIKNDNSKNINSGRTNSVKNNGEIPQEVKDESPAPENLYCPYDNSKSKCNNCKYVNTNSKRMLSASKEGSSTTPSAILRSNYEKHFDELVSTRKKYRKPFYSVSEEYDKFRNVFVGNAAHHILSTNDVFAQNKLEYVLKLANFYEYDVNEPYNCIILPGTNMEDEKKKTADHVKFGAMTDYEKRKIKFSAMRDTERQWHGGGHGINYENEHNISCYAQEASDLLYSYMKNEKKDHCRADEKYYQKDKPVTVCQALFKRFSTYKFSTHGHDK